MLRRYVKDYDVPLLGADIDLWQKVFNIVSRQVHTERGSELERQLAANIVRFYRQGIRSEAQLLIMARTSAIS
jgi:hypothetical protein